MVGVLERLGREFASDLAGAGLLDRDGCWLEVSPALCGMLGRKADALIGRPVAEVTHPEDAGADLARPEAAGIPGGPVQTVEKRFVRDDGSVLWARVTTTAVIGDDGRPNAVFCQLEDISGRKRAEQLLRASDERFERVFEDAPVGMTLNSPVPGERGRILRVNAAFCRLVGRRPDELVGQFPAGLLHPDDVEVGRADWYRLLAGRAGTVSCERRVVRADGAIRLVRCSASIVHDGAGEPLYVVAQQFDVTDVWEPERRFQAAFEDAPVAMVLSSADPRHAGRTLRVNEAMCDLLGSDAESILAMPAATFFTGPSRATVLAEFRQLVVGERAEVVSDYELQRADGATVWASVSASLVRDAAGAPSYVIAHFQDVTSERVAGRVAEKRLAQQTAVARLGQRALDEDDLAALFDAAVGMVAATCEAPYAALYLCEAGQLRRAAQVGWPAEVRPRDLDPRGSHAAYTVHADTPVIVDDCAAEHRFTITPLDGFPAASGMSVAIAGESGEPCGALTVNAIEPGAFSGDDIAFLSSVANVLTGAIRRAAAARELRHQSLHDPLTQLPNRVLMLDRLRHGLARSRRDGSMLAVLFCDLDDFKHVNDTLGHDAGDRLLAELALRLRGALRTPDTLARFGGDEFVMLCEGLADPAEALAVADRVLAACARPIDLGGAEFVPTASIGIALAEAATYADPESLLRDADVAMYRAKTRGKGRYELFDATMRQQTVERVALLADLRRAIARDELRLLFQPVVSLRRREVSALEALVRWEHPVRGLLVPDQFIGLAEDAGLIDEIGAWVIDEAVCQAAAWQRAGTPGLNGAVCSVNVSWRQLSSGTLLQTVADALERHDLDATFLCAEVTESAVLEDPERAAASLAALGDLGVYLALDDFGTGQSSLAVLRNFPFDALKLDRSFAAAGDWDVVRAVVQMARSLDLRVIAEGIERADQDATATALDCDYGQGWRFGRPVAAHALERLVAPLTARLRAGA